MARGIAMLFGGGNLYPEESDSNRPESKKPPEKRGEASEFWEGVLTVLGRFLFYGGITLIIVGIATSP